MRPHSHRLAIPALSIAVALVAPRLCLAAICPTNTILDTTSTNAHEKASHDAGIAGENAEYDLVAGKLTGSFWTVVDANIPLLTVSDEYTIEGLPAGTPVVI